MRIFICPLFIFLLTFTSSFAQNISDDFEGNGNITTWFGDDCGLDTDFTNPFQNGINTSAKVLRYSDNGGQYANVRFDASSNFTLVYNPIFSLKIYVPSSGITGNQPNQISLKLQNGDLNEPWSTQTEIIKPLVLNQWQTITFDFANDNYINLDGNSPNPINRFDFNRVLIQLNGENNNDQVVAYVDDFFYDASNSAGGPVFDNLVWSDEFDGNGAINSSKWHHQTQLPSGGSWFNNEIQHYTNRLVNSYVSDGFLNIVAKREFFNDQGHTKPFTSARLNSKFAFQYGRVEVRAKLPFGAGTWPAIWMLGKNITEAGGFWASTYGTTGWPACGEIDIMEHWGNNQNFVQSALHTPSSSGNTVNHGGQMIPTVSTQFHVYSVDWTEERMIFSVDDVVHYIYNPPVKNAATWPFDAEQYILLNIAIQDNISPNFTEDAMEIDYVRVYQETPLSTSDMVKNKNLVLSPNPVDNELSIEINSNLIGTEAELYSILGQKIMTFSLTDKTNTIDLSTLESGVYVMKIKNELGSYSSKFIKN